MSYRSLVRETAYSGAFALKDELEKLGAEVETVKEPFNPEGGAYGHGRTHSHAH